MDNQKKYKSFTVIGAARSGIAVARLLKDRGYNVFLSDSEDMPKINKKYLNELSENHITSEFGYHSDKVYECDAMVVSPGVRQDAGILKKADKSSIDVFSEIEIASWFFKGKIISITGTNGKTTTTTLIGELLKDANFNSQVCGNIGIAFSDVVELISENGYAVVEASSFQLDNITSFRPFISVLLNITPDHLDRYDKSFEKYIKSKMRICMNQKITDYFVYNLDDKIIYQNISEINNVTMIPVSTEKNLHAYPQSAYLDKNKIIFNDNGKENEIINTNELIIKGMHNVYNVLASVCVAKLCGVDNDIIRETLRNFKGVEHRLEFVRELHGIKWYNDSKATNVNSVWYALQGFEEPIILILGGRDKGNDYTEIENVVNKNVKLIIAVGESKDKVYEFFKNSKEVYKAIDMENAVKLAAENSERGDVVLLSPACASFDMFENYEHRGDIFKELVNKL